MSNQNCNHSPWITAERVFRIMPPINIPDCCPPNLIPDHCCQRNNNMFLLPGCGINIDLKNVAKGSVSIGLANLPISCSILRGALVKIDFSTIFKVEEGKKVQLLIALKRNCNGSSTILQTYELEFDAVESLPFSFTYTDSDIWCGCGCGCWCCLYTVEIINVNVIGGNNVNRIQTNSTAMNALVQQY